jgi:hypothetical protein
MPFKRSPKLSYSPTRTRAVIYSRKRPGCQRIFIDDPLRCLLEKTLTPRLPPRDRTLAETRAPGRLSAEVRLPYAQVESLPR